MVCLWCGRMDGRSYGHLITKISRMDGLPNFLRYGAPLARALRTRRAPQVSLSSGFHYFGFSPISVRTGSPVNASQF